MLQADTRPFSVTDHLVALVQAFKNTSPGCSLQIRTRHRDVKGLVKKQLSQSKLLQFSQPLPCQYKCIRPHCVGQLGAKRGDGTCQPVRRDSKIRPIIAAKTTCQQQETTGALPVFD
jgi:hypothetical protein